MLEVDEDPVDELDKPGTTIGTKFSVLHGIQSFFKNEVWFLSIGPASTLLGGHLALATLSPPETDPQILERWGCADEVHLGKYIRTKDFGLEFSVTCNSICEFHMLDWFLHV